MKSRRPLRLRKPRHRAVDRRDQRRFARAAARRCGPALRRPGKADHRWGRCRSRRCRDDAACVAQPDHHAAVTEEADGAHPAMSGGRWPDRRISDALAERGGFCRAPRLEGRGYRGRTYRCGHDAIHAPAPASAADEACLPIRDGGLLTSAELSYPGAAAGLERAAKRLAGGGQPSRDGSPQNGHRQGQDSPERQNPRPTSARRRFAQNRNLEPTPPTPQLG